MKEEMKRKPYSDITNTFSLIPISTLRKLVDSTSKSSGGVLSRHRNLILNEIASSTKRSIPSDASKSCTGSSSVGNSGNRRTIRFQTPPRASSAGTVHGVVENKAAAYNTRNLIEKTGKGRGSDAVSVGPHRSSETRRDKANAVPSCSSPVGKIKGDQVEIMNADCSTGRKNGNYKGILDLLTGPEGGFISFARSEKGKGIASSSCSLGGQEVSGNCSTSLSSCSPGEINGIKKGTLKPSSLLILESEETGNEISSSSFSSQEIEKSGKRLFPLGSSHENTVEILQPSNIAEKKKLASAALVINVQSSRRKIEKRKTNESSGCFSCPPVMKAKNKGTDFIDLGDKPFISRTASSSKASKKSRFAEMDPDFIQKQNAYFKEVDAFLIEEEEASGEELD